MSKRVTAFLLAFVMLVSAFSVQAFAKGPGYDDYIDEGAKVCDDPSDMLSFVLARHLEAPIRIVEAKLIKDGAETDIYLIGLVGVEMNGKQVNTVGNAFKSGFSKPNAYVDLLKEVIKDNIPEGSNIVFCGHSLGGMVAQQVSADNEIKENYNILCTLTAGSPFIVTDEKEGELHRICDKNDIIPYLSVALVKARNALMNERSVEDGGYFFDPDGAHNRSYRREAVWGEYDAVGVKGGSTVITFDYETLQTYGYVPA